MNSKGNEINSKKFKEVLKCCHKKCFQKISESKQFNEFNRFLIFIHFCHQKLYKIHFN
jgi:hypothetical protein